MVLKFGLPLMLVCFVLSACKKGNDPDPDDTHLGSAYTGKVAGYQDKPLYYNSEGLLVEYSPNSSNTYQLEWTENKLTIRKKSDGTIVEEYQRDADGYCLGPDWMYDSQHQTTTWFGNPFYWSNGDVDSAGTTVKTVYHYTTDLDTRDYGYRFIPSLPGGMRPVVSLHLPSVAYSISSADTTNRDEFSYEFDGQGRVVKETVTTTPYVNGVPQTSSISKVTSYTYY